MICDESERIRVHLRVQRDGGTEQVHTNNIKNIACGKIPQAQDLAGKGEC